MFGTEHLGVFILSGLLLNVTPGQDTLYIVGRSVAQGRRAGVLSVLGISSGSAVHTVAAAFGLSAMLATSTHVFAVVKLLGSAYLIYLGIRLFLERPTQRDTGPVFHAESGWSVYRAGLLTNLLNPKVALFFLAFLPQFVASSTESSAVPFLFLGGVFIVNGTLWCLVLVWGASTIGRHLRASSSASLLKRAAGIMFIGLGVRVALSR